MISIETSSQYIIILYKKIANWASRTVQNKMCMRKIFCVKLNLIFDLACLSQR